jgi:hypothetical protein
LADTFAREEDSGTFLALRESVTNANGWLGILVQEWQC